MPQIIDVTIITENDFGHEGVEHWKAISPTTLLARANLLESQGWAIIEIQHGESGDTLEFEKIGFESIYC